MRPRFLSVLAAWLAVAANPSAAQNKSAPATGASIVLSPFTVNTEKDAGYAANETLSGTRMRTDLKDVSVSLSILTPQFIQDLQTDCFEDARAGELDEVDIEVGGEIGRAHV